MAKKKSYLERIYDALEEIDACVQMLPGDAEIRRVKGALNSLRSGLRLYEASLTARDAKVLVIDKSTGEGHMVTGQVATLAALAAQSPEMFEAMKKGLKSLAKDYAIFAEMYGSNAEKVFGSIATVDNTVQEASHDKD